MMATEDCGSGAGNIPEAWAEEKRRACGAHRRPSITALCAEHPRLPLEDVGAAQQLAVLALVQHEVLLERGA
eukprot:COSAG01_NODE_28697_length_655_cov_0.742806_1_plen_71_part_10